MCDVCRATGMFITAFWIHVDGCASYGDPQLLTKEAKVSLMLLGNCSHKESKSFVYASPSTHLVWVCLRLAATPSDA